MQNTTKNQRVTLLLNEADIEANLRQYGDVLLEKIS